MILRDYQREGSLWLRGRNGILAWEPGVGKTLTALDAATCGDGPVLYICPANLRWQVAEAAQGYIPQARVQVLGGGKDPLDPNADIVVMSYEGASRPERWKELFKRQWRVIICDEGHALKSPEAARTRAFYGATTRSKGALHKRAHRMWVLTGTPILNDPSEIWTHYSRLFPFAVTNDDGDPLTRAEWIDRFCKTKNDGFGEKIVGGKNLAELQELLRPWMHVVKSAEVLDLDKPTIDTIPLSPIGLLKGTVPDHAIAAVRACLSKDEPLDGLQDSLATERRLIGVAKAEAVASLARQELEGGRDKIVIFAHHIEVVGRITDMLKGFGAVAFTGATKHAAKATFLTDPACRVIVGNIQAFGIGTDGLQKVCARAIFAEADWTPGINDQCVRRLWRSGQTRPVHVSFAALKGSIDEDIQRALVRKQKIIHEVMS